MENKITVAITEVGAFLPEYRLTNKELSTMVYNKNTFQLQDENQLKEYLNGGIIKTDIKSNGQKVIKFKNYVLGTAIQLENRLKSQFPKSKRVSEIKIAS